MKKPFHFYLRHLSTLSYLSKYPLKRVSWASLLLFLTLFLLVPQAHASLGNTRTINFQGRVVNKSDGTNVADGTYSFTFKLYDAASSGNLLWQETQSSVQVTSGIFTVQLGSSTAFNAGGYNVNFNTSPLYLDITFNGETFGSRVQLATVPYALNAETLDGVIATSSATGFTLTGGQSAAKTLTINNTLGLSGTDGTTFTFPTTSNGTILTSNAPTQSITSTQTTGTILGISDSTAETAATTGLSITMSGSGAFDQTGLSFNLSNASGSNLNDIVGTGGTWKISRAGALTVTSCSGCSGAAVGGLNQVPTSNTAGASGANVVAPTAAGIIGMTINGTSNASTTADALDVNTIPATGLTATNGLLVQQNGAGTTTNGIQVQQTSGTLTNGLTFSGTFTKYINSTNFNVTNAGAMSATSQALTPAAGTAGLSVTQSNTPTVDLATIADTSGQEPTANGVDGLQITWLTKPSTNNISDAEQLVVTNKNTTTAGQADGLRITATGAGTGVNSNTVGLYIDPLASASNVATGENAIQIGSGWDNAISAAGNIELEAKTNTADSQANYWTDHAVAAGTLNTTPVIASVSASVTYNGSLYVGTFNPGKAEVYRYNGSGTSWTALNSTAGTLNSTSAIDGITAMAVYNGYLYVGTAKTTASQAEIYRYDGGSTFTAVDTSAGTIGGVASIASVSAMTVWNGDLYAGVCKTGAAEIFKYQGGTTWLPVSGAGTIATTTGVNCITSLVSYNNFLIAGDAKPASAEVYRYTGGTTWIRLNPTAGTFTTTSSGGTSASSVDAVTAMTVYDGHLVVGLRKNSGGDVVEYVDNTAALAPVNDWARLNNAAGTIVSGGNTINSVSALGVYNGVLYVGTEATNGAEIWKYSIGEVGSAGWTKVSQNTKGTIGSTGTPTTNIGMVTQLLQYNNDFWAGTFQQPGGAEMYSLTVVSDQSYALKFHAAATQSEQNGLQNLGSISFVASPSANVNTAGGGTGAFVFSNTIQTANGAYDVAEDYPTRDQLIQPGDLVAIDTKEKGMVKRSDSVNSTTVIGVYSSHPGFDLSQDGNLIDGVPAIPVALVGRVPVNVSSESGQILAGDYITSSSRAGIGMKAITAGPIIGQALQSYDPSLADGNGVEQILIFVSHGYYNGISQDALAGLSGSGDLSAVQFIANTETTALNASNAENSSEAQHVILGSETTPESTASDSGHTAFARMTSLEDLQVTGLATISADLRVEHNALIEGILNVVDTLMANNFIVNGLSDFFGNVLFHGDVAFQHAPTFTPDTAGYAVLHKGDMQVQVTFTKSYPVAPVVNATIVTVTPQSDLQTIFDNKYAYVVTNISSTGFTIALNKQAADDVTFSWSAFLVNPSVTPAFQQSFGSNQDKSSEQATTSLQTSGAVAGAADISTAPLASSSGQ